MKTKIHSTKADWGAEIDKLIQKDTREIMIVVVKDENDKILPLVFSGEFVDPGKFYAEGRLDLFRLTSWIQTNRRYLTTKFDMATPCPEEFCYMLDRASRRIETDILGTATQRSVVDYMPLRDLQGRDYKIIWIGSGKLRIKQTVTAGIFISSAKEAKVPNKLLGDVVAPFKDVFVRPKESDESVDEETEETEEDSSPACCENSERPRGSSELATILCDMTSTFGLLQTTKNTLMDPGHRVPINKNKVAIRNNDVFQFRGSDMINFIHMVGANMSKDLLLLAMGNSPKKRISMPTAPFGESNNTLDIIATTMIATGLISLTKLNDPMTPLDGADSIRDEDGEIGFMQEYPKDDPLDVQWILLISKTSMEKALEHLKSQFHSGRPNKLRINDVIEMAGGITLLPEHSADKEYISIDLSKVNGFINKASKYIEFPEVRKMIQLGKDFIDRKYEAIADSIEESENDEDGESQVKDFDYKKVPADLIYLPDPYDHVYDNGEKLLRPIELSEILGNLAQVFGLLQRTERSLMGAGHRVSIRGNNVAVRNQTVLQFKKPDILNFIRNLGGHPASNLSPEAAEILCMDENESPIRRISMVASNAPFDDVTITLATMISLLRSARILRSDNGLPLSLMAGKSGHEFTAITYGLSEPKMLITEKSLKMLLVDVRRHVHAGKGNMLSAGKIMERYSNRVSLKSFDNNLTDEYIEIDLLPVKRYLDKVSDFILFDTFDKF